MSGWGGTGFSKVALGSSASWIWLGVIYDSSEDSTPLVRAGLQFENPPGFATSAQGADGSHGLGGLYTKSSCISIVPFPDWEPLLTITHALITTQLDYCNT